MKKQERWQLIAKGAAEQSGRGVIPEVCGVCSFTEALEQAESLDVVLIPYELEEGMAETVSWILSIQNHTSTSEASLIPHRASPEVSRLHPNFLAKLSQNLKSPLQP